MSRINDLIKELCPNGVVFKTVGDMCNVYTGGETPTDLIKEKVPRDDYIYPVYSNGIGSNALYGYAKTYRIKDDAVTFSSIGTLGHPEIRKGKFTPIIRLKVLVPINLKQLSIGYLKYALETAEFDNNKSSLPNLNANMLKNIVIPIPPLEVQNEIVRILDKFGELEAELEAELEERKSQYEFWREKIINMYESKNIRLLDIAKIYDGTHSTPNYQLSGIPFISVENISDIYGSSKFISEEDFQKYKIKPQINDVFMTRIGSIGKCSVFDKQVDLAYYVSLALIRPNTDIILPKYLKYVIESNVGKNELYKRTLVHAVPIKVNKDEIGKIILPVPSIENQKKIISKLDKFESLTESMSVGLPAEIELRRKQYEYYRNKLLSFEELSVSE